MKNTIKQVSDGLAELKLALEDIRKEHRSSSPEQLELSIVSLHWGVSVLGDKIAALLLSDRLELNLVALLADSGESDHKQAMAAATAAIAVLDRSKLSVGLPLCTEQELTEFCGVVFHRLRALTGNANVPDGGVQA